MTWEPAYDIEECVTSHELIILAGITYRQMDYWTRTGRLTACPDGLAGSGHPRFFPVEQVHLARTMKQLVDAGVSVVVAHVAAHQLITEGRADLGAFSLTPRATDQQGDPAT